VSSTGESEAGSFPYKIRTADCFARRVRKARARRFDMHSDRSGLTPYQARYFATPRFYTLHGVILCSVMAYLSVAAGKLRGFRQSELENDVVE
jgi:hypothetical protein